MVLPGSESGQKGLWGHVSYEKPAAPALRAGGLRPRIGRAAPFQTIPLLVLVKVNLDSTGWRLSLPVRRDIVESLFLLRSGPRRRFTLPVYGMSPNPKRAGLSSNPNPPTTPRGTQP